MQHIFTTSSIFQSKMLSLCEKSSHFACPFQTRIPKVPLKSWPFKISVALHPKSHSTLPVHSRLEILRVLLKSLNLNISALQKKMASILEKLSADFTDLQETERKFCFSCKIHFKCTRGDRGVDELHYLLIWWRSIAGLIWVQWNCPTFFNCMDFKTHNMFFAKCYLQASNGHQKASTQCQGQVFWSEMMFN